MLRILGFCCCGLDSVPGWGTEILQVMQHSQKKKKKKERNNRWLEWTWEKAMAPHSSTLAQPRSKVKKKREKINNRWLEWTWEKAMAPHSSTLAWKLPWTEEPGRLQSMGSLRVRHDWATSLSLFTSLHWRRKWQPTPVFLPGESQGRGSLVGCCMWGHIELNMTEAT